MTPDIAGRPRGLAASFAEENTPRSLARGEIGAFHARQSPGGAPAWGVFEPVWRLPLPLPPPAIQPLAAKICLAASNTIRGSQAPVRPFTPDRSSANAEARRKQIAEKQLPRLRCSSARSSDAGHARGADGSLRSNVRPEPALCRVWYGARFDAAQGPQASQATRTCRLCQMRCFLKPSEGPPGILG